MKRTHSIILFALLLTVSMLAQAQQLQTQRFTPVEGPNLSSRIEAAVKLGKATQPRGHFWVAYGFDVRPGVAIDLEIVEANGSFTFLEGTSVTIDPRYETRNLGVFLLYEPGSENISRVEVYNLQRQHEYSGYPVYWTGRAGNEESLNFLRSLIAPNQTNRIPERALLAIAVHDDQRVEQLLIDLIRRPPVEGLRSRAIYWLGQFPGSATKQSFLADIARNEGESTEIRGSAVSAIGASHDTATLNLLETLYASFTSQELKKRALSGISTNDNKDAAAAFLMRVASNANTDTELKKKAISSLGVIASQRALETLGGTIAATSDADTEVQKQAVYAIARRPKDEAIPLLIKTARTHPKAQVRKTAIYWLGQIGDERALDFFRELLAK